MPARGAAPGFVAAPRGTPSPAAPARVPRAAMIASSRSDCRIGLVRYAATPSSRQRAASPACPAEESIMTCARSGRGSCPDRLRQREAVHLRHHRVQQHQRRTAGRASRPAPGRERRRPALRRRRLHSPVGEHFLQDAPVGARCRPPPARAAPAAGTARAVPALTRTSAARAEPDGEVEGAALAPPRSPPRCGRPSIAPAAPRSPAPARCRRTCASWSCPPGRTPRRSASCFSGGMPMPVSRTAKWRRTSRVRAEGSGQPSCPSASCPSALRL